MRILYEDEHLLALDKPAGLAVHEDGRTDVSVLTDWVRKERPEIVGVGETMRLQNGSVIDRPGVVHRLDRDTSGVLVLAKTQEAFLFLKQQFKDRRIEKHYRAFVWGDIREPHGTIDRPIGRSRRDFRLWSATQSAGGKLRPAVTRYSVLVVGGGLSSPNSKLQSQNSFTYIDLEPKTGRTHQIRVHLKAIGHPVVCDERYAPDKGPALGFTRLALHAFSLTLTHPSGSTLALEAQLPPDFTEALSLLTEPK